MRTDRGYGYGQAQPQDRQQDGAQGSRDARRRQGPKTAIDGHTTRHKSYEISQRCRKRIEESFAWAKTIGGAARLKVKGLARANAVFTPQMIAYNLVRIPRLLAKAA